MALNFHDHTIYKYVVDYETRTLIFYSKLNEDKLEITFSGLLAHEFVDNINFCIVYDIEEIEPETFIEYYRKDKLFERKVYGWPINFKEENEFYENLKKKNIKIFTINSSYGLNGFVFAEEMNVIDQNN